MASKDNRFLMVVTLLSTLTALPVVAQGALVTNPTSISGGGMIGGGDWTSNVSPWWSVADAGSAYLGASNAYKLGTFSTGPSNPGWPAGESRYGIKFENFTGNTPWTFTLLSDRAPMEGDFNAKGGETSFAYHSGFGALDGAKILVPDTATIRVLGAVTLFFIGGGLMSIAVWRRRWLRMQG